MRQVVSAPPSSRSSGQQVAERRHDPRRAVAPLDAVGSVPTTGGQFTASPSQTAADAAPARRVAAARRRRGSREGRGRCPRTRARARGTAPAGQGSCVQSPSPLLPLLGEDRGRVIGHSSSRPAARAASIVPGRAPEDLPGRVAFVRRRQFAEAAVVRPREHEQTRSRRAKRLAGLLAVRRLAVAVEHRCGERVEIERRAETAERPDHSSPRRGTGSSIGRDDLAVVVERMSGPAVSVERRLRVSDDRGYRLASAPLVPRGHARTAHSTLARFGIA